MRTLTFAVFNAHGNQMTPARQLVIDDGDNDIPLEAPIHLEPGWVIRYRVDGAGDSAYVCGEAMEAGSLLVIGQRDDDG